MWLDDMALSKDADRIQEIDSDLASEMKRLSFQAGHDGLVEVPDDLLEKFQDAIRVKEWHLKISRLLD